jgi:hypothetical protein
MQNGYKFSGGLWKSPLFLLQRWLSKSFFSRVQVRVAKKEKIIVGYVVLSHKLREMPDFSKRALKYLRHQPSEDSDQLESYTIYPVEHQNHRRYG